MKIKEVTGDSPFLYYEGEAEEFKGMVLNLPEIKYEDNCRSEILSATPLQKLKVTAKFNSPFTVIKVEKI